MYKIRHCSIVHNSENCIQLKYSIDTIIELEYIHNFIYYVVIKIIGKSIYIYMKMYLRYSEKSKLQNSVKYDFIFVK